MLKEMIWSCYSARLLKRATVATLKKICKNLNFGEVVVGADDFFFVGLLSKNGFEASIGDALLFGIHGGVAMKIDEITMGWKLVFPTII